MNILTAMEVRELDKETINSGKSGMELMENAGLGFVQALTRRLGDITGKSILVFTGSGNNGGDGVVIARYLEKRKAVVEVILLADENKIKNEALRNLERAKKLENIKFTSGLDISLNEIEQKLSSCDVIVDAIYGTGFHGKITGRVKDVIERINDSGAYTVACDIPSGVNGDAGTIECGTAVNADTTITFGYPKWGLFISPGKNYAGSIEVVDIGLAVKSNKSRYQLTVTGEVKAILKKRKKDVYKNNFGHLLVLAGCRGMTGAAALACSGALRSGAGLVTLGVPQSVVNVFAVKLTEAMILPLPETKEGTTGAGAFKIINEFMQRKKINAIAIGPGLSTNEETQELVRKLVSDTRVPCVLDADGINAFSGHESLLGTVKSKVIITPHQGELSRLIKKDIKDIEKDRIGTAKSFAKKYGLICVLKGYQTVISNGIYSFINPTGNPGMASGGTGDVLTGILAGLLCQLPRADILDIARAGVFLHGLAGDIALQEKGEMSLIASDIIDGIAEAIKIIKK